MEKVGHLRVRQFQGVPFARETWKKWAIWGFDNFKEYHLRGNHGTSGPLEGSTILRFTICEGNMEKVGHLRAQQFQGVPFASKTCKKGATWRFDNFKAYYLRGKHGKSGPLEGSTIFRCSICEGNMEKVGHLRVWQFEGVPFARETWKKWTTWLFDNFKAYHLRGKHGKSGPLEGSTILRCTICEVNMEKVGHLRVRQFEGVPFASETWKKWTTWGSTISRRTICEGNMEKVGHFRVRQLQGVPFARETWKKWATWGFDNFKVFHFRGKHRKSGPLEGSTISRRTIYEGNMEKVGHLSVGQF